VVKRAEYLGPEKRRPLVLDAAQAIFAEGGFADASMSAIAERAGVAKAVLYDCFPGGKAEIYTSLIERNERSIMDHLLAMLDYTNRLPLEEALTEAMHRFVAYARNHPLEFRLIFSDVGSADPKLAQRARRTKELMLVKMHERTAQIMEAGGIPIGPYAGVYNRMFLAMQEEMARWALDEPDLPLDKLTSAIIGWLMRGFENILPGDAWNKPLPG